MRYQAHMWKKPGLLIKAPGTLKNPAELELAAKPAAVPSAAWGRGARGRQEEDQEGKVKKAQETLQQHFLFQLTGSTDSRRDKRRSKVKRKASQSGHRLEQKDVEELQQFCRQAEIQKLREEVLASMQHAQHARQKCKTGPACQWAGGHCSRSSFPQNKEGCACSVPDFDTRFRVQTSTWSDVMGGRAGTTQYPVGSRHQILVCSDLWACAKKQKWLYRKEMDQLQSSDWTGSPRGQSLSPTVSLLHPDRWLQLCFLSFFTGFVLGFSMAESGLSTPRWLPAPFARSVRYVQALKVSQSLSVGRVCSVTLASEYHWHTQQSVQAPYCLGTSGFQKGTQQWTESGGGSVMRRRHQSDKPKSLLLFHLMKASSVPFFDWEGFHATHELSVDEASLFFWCWWLRVCILEACSLSYRA